MSSPVGRSALWWLAVKRIAANEVDRLALDVVMWGVVWSPGGVTPNVSVLELRESMQADVVARRAVRDLEYYLASVVHSQAESMARGSQG